MGNKRQKRKNIQRAVKLKTLGKLLIFSSEVKAEAIPLQTEITEEESLKEKTDISKEIKEKKTESLKTLAETFLFHTDPVQEPLFPSSIEYVSLEELLQQVTTPKEEGNLNKDLSLSTTTFSERSRESSFMLKKILNKKLNKPDKKVFSFQEINGFEQIYKHRQLLSHFAEQIASLAITPLQERPPLVEDLINKICQTIEQLEKETLGIPCFSFPWIKGNDQVCFEFRKEAPKKWMFILHHRGHGLKNKVFHGEIYLKIGKCIYGKTSVRIETAKKDVLEDRFFLHSLVDLLLGEGTIEQVYALVKKHFLDSGEGKIEISLKEAQVLEALKNTQKEKILPLIEELCKEDLCFDTIQRNGTKNNSTLTLPEKWLAPPTVKKYLALFSFIQQTSYFKHGAILPEHKSSSSLDPLKKHRWKWKKEISTDFAAAA